MPPKFVRKPDRDDYASSGASERMNLLQDNSDEEDFFLNGPNARPGRLVPKKDNKVARLQGQVDEVIDVMKDNVGKVLERGDRLEDLQDKSENLSTNADLFRVRAKGLKTTMWWRECKMRVILVLVVVVILCIIIIPIIVQNTKH